MSGRGGGRTGGAVRVAAAAVLLLVGAAATVSAPTDDEVQAPIESRGAVGRTVVARTIAAQVHGVEVARRIEFPDDPAAAAVTSAGAWVVVDVTVSCRLQPCGFSRSELRVAGRSYAQAVVAPSPSFADLFVNPRLSYRASALFEVPASALRSGRARLVVQSNETTALDGVPVIALRLPAETAPVADARAARLTGAAP